MGKIIYHPFIIFLTALLGIAFFLSLNKSAQKTEVSSNNIEVLEKEVSEMSKKVIETEEKIMETQTEEFKEKVIRNELLLQKPGEYVIQLPNFENREDLDSENLEKNKPIYEWLKLMNI